MYARTECLPNCSRAARRCPPAELRRFHRLLQHIHLRPPFKHRIQYQIVHRDDRHFFMLVKRLEQTRQMFGKRRYLRRRHEISPDIRIAGNGKCEQQIVAQPVDV